MEDLEFVVGEGRCGSCTLCCRLTAIPELQKPLNTWCHCCEINKGCRVYKTRPQSCRKFECVWYKKRDLLPELRPDRCGVMFEKLFGTNTYLALLSSENSRAWHVPPVKTAILGLLESGAVVIVLIGTGTEKHLLLPIGKTEEEVIEELNSILPNYYPGV